MKQQNNKIMKHAKHKSKYTDCNHIIELVENTVTCNKNMIHQIDTIIETNYLPNSVKESLITQRNTCAVIFMNMMQEIKKYKA